MGFCSVSFMTRRLIYLVTVKRETVKNLSEKYQHVYLDYFFTFKKNRIFRNDKKEENNDCQ